MGNFIPTSFLIGDSHVTSYAAVIKTLLLSSFLLIEYFSGIESFSKLGDSIYFEEGGENPGLYIIQYISSSLSWELGKLKLDQKVDPVNSWDPYLRVTLTVSPVGTVKPSTLNLRIPSWTHSNGAKAKLNGQDISLTSPG